RQALRLAENREALKQTEADGFPCHGNAQCVNDLRVANAFGLNEILKVLLDRRRIEGFKRGEIRSELLQQARRFRGSANALVESSFVVRQLIAGNEESRVVQDVAGNLDAVC